MGVEPPDMTAVTTSSAPSAPARARDEAFDVLKGIGITEVILHHCLSHTARKYAPPDSLHHQILMVLNWVVHWGVPVFLMASTVLLARAALARDRPDWGRYYRRRALRTVWPYLVWTTFYLFFRGFVVRDWDGAPYGVVWFGREMTVPYLFTDANLLATAYWNGRGYFHLYFLAVLLQLMLVFPALFYLGRWARHAPMAAFIAVAVVLQIGVYLLQRQIRYPTPATTLLWYLPALSVGLWIGLNRERWAVIGRRGVAAFGLLAVAGGTTYVTLALRRTAGLPIDTMLYSLSAHLYAVGLATLLLRWAQSLPRTERGRRWYRFWGEIGDMSLPLFVMHPAIMFLLSGPRVSGVIAQTPVPLVTVFSLTFGLSWLLARVLIRIRLGPLLFGRSYAARGA